MTSNEVWIAAAGLCGVVLTKALDVILARGVKTDDLVQQDRDQLLRESRELREELRKEVTRLNTALSNLSQELEKTRVDLHTERTKRETLENDLQRLRIFAVSAVEAHPCDHDCGILEALAKGPGGGK